MMPIALFYKFLIACRVIEQFFFKVNLSKHSLGVKQFQLVCKGNSREKVKRFFVFSASRYQSVNINRDIIGSKYIIKIS